LMAWRTCQTYKLLINVGIWRGGSSSRNIFAERIKGIFEESSTVDPPQMDAKCLSPIETLQTVQLDRFPFMFEFCMSLTSQYEVDFEKIVLQYTKLISCLPHLQHVGTVTSPRFLCRKRCRDHQ
uniref:RGS domain-containing protein n=1 Tax=Haemonchus placei TaxID=6290 RepID=A0A0N4WTY4_HAEPC